LSDNNFFVIFAVSPLMSFRSAFLHYSSFLFVRKPFWGVLLLVVFGLLLRSVYLFNNPLLDRDSINYCEIAESWHRTNRYDIPLQHGVGSTDAGYILLLKKGLDFHVPVVLWGRAIDLLSTIAYFVAVYFIGLSFFKDHRAFLLLFIACIHPSTGQLSFALLRDPLCYALYSICILALLNLFQNNSFVWTAVFSVFVVLAFFIRYEALELFAIFLLLSVFALKHHNDKRFLILSVLECFVIAIALMFIILFSVNLPLQKPFFDISSKLTSVLPI